MASAARVQARQALLAPAVASRTSAFLAAAPQPHGHTKHLCKPALCRLQALVRASGAAADSTAAAAAAASPVAAPAWNQHSWLWRGHRVRYITAGKFMWCS